MPDVTFVIPVAPYHDHLLSRAVDSINAQTVKAAYVILRDTDRNGAGWARNRGLELVQTPMVSFLDADDWLAPTFVERCLAVYTGERYIYTDHYEDDQRVDAPDCPWVRGSWHVITSLLPTPWVRAVGGFDETLNAGEDTAFYAALVWNGYCGQRLREPLFHYSKEGQRSRGFLNTPAHEALMFRLTQQYGDKRMSCCGEAAPIDAPPVGEQLAGDVLAVALWGGNRQQRGTITGRLYPRTGNGKQVYVAAVDVDAAPHLWQRVQRVPAPQRPTLSATPTPPPVLEPDMSALVGRMGVRLPPPSSPAPEGERAHPDVSRLVERARRAFSNDQA